MCLCVCVRIPDYVEWSRDIEGCLRLFTQRAHAMPPSNVFTQGVRRAVRVTHRLVPVAPRATANAKYPVKPWPCTHAVDGRTSAAAFLDDAVIAYLDYDMSVPSLPAIDQPLGRQASARNCLCGQPWRWIVHAPP